MIKTALAQFAVQEPKPEQIVAELFVGNPLTAHAVKGREPLLGREAGPARVFIQFVEEERELFAALRPRADPIFAGGRDSYTGLYVLV